MSEDLVHELNGVALNKVKHDPKSLSTPLRTFLEDVAKDAGIEVKVKKASVSKIEEMVRLEAEIEAYGKTLRFGKSWHEREMLMFNLPITQLFRDALFDVLKEMKEK
jgi:hypothetical protein